MIFYIATTCGVLGLFGGLSEYIKLRNVDRMIAREICAVLWFILAALVR